MRMKSIILAAALSFSGCAEVGEATYADIRIQNSLFACGANKETIEDLLADIWDSGFLVKNEAVEEEILDNNYTIFSDSSKLNLANPSELCIFYMPESASLPESKGKDFHIMIHKRLFSHLELDCVVKEGFRYSQKACMVAMSENLEPGLVKAQFYDFWHNFLDTYRKAGFFVESSILYEEIMGVKTDAGKVKLLKAMGYSDPRPRDLEPFLKLRKKRESSVSSILDIGNTRYFEGEMYSDIAELAYRKHILVPKQLRKFYEGIVSKARLEKDRL